MSLIAPTVTALFHGTVSGSSWHGSVACCSSNVYSRASFISRQAVWLLLPCRSVVRVSVFFCLFFICSVCVRVILILFQ